MLVKEFEKLDVEAIEREWQAVDAFFHGRPSSLHNGFEYNKAREREHSQVIPKLMSYIKSLEELVDMFGRQSEGLRGEVEFLNALMESDGYDVSPGRERLAMFDRERPTAPASAPTRPTTQEGG